MPLRDDLLTPIPGDNPSGVNLRYDPVTDKIKEARREEIDAPQGDWKTTLKTADYAQVIKLAGEVIAKRSKDLQLAAWLVDAHVRREGFGLLAPCFSFLRDLLDQFWDTLYPELEDGDTEVRSAPLEWLGTKLDQPLRMFPISSSGFNLIQYKESRVIGYEQDATTPEKQRARQQAINDHKPTGEDFDGAVDATPRAFYDNAQKALSEGLEALENLNSFCDEKFGEYAPSFVKTRTAIEEIAQQTRIFLNKKGGAAPPVAAPVPDPVPVAQVAAGGAAAAVAPAYAPPPPPPAPPPPVASFSAEPADVADAVRRIAAVCKYLREKTNLDAVAFLVIRAFRWGELRAKAPKVEPLMLEAPPSEMRAEIKRLFLESQWDAVLEATERAMELACGRAWFDLQRYTVQALEKKGPWFLGVAGAIKSELRVLLQDIPGLLDQTLTDDTPVANPETRQWITEEVMAGAAFPAPPPAAVVEPEPERARAAQPVAPALDEAEKPAEIEPDESATAIPDIFDEALEAARNGRRGEAVDMISKQLSTERSGRARFRRRAQLAHVLVVAGHDKIALPILEDLTAEIEQRRLEDWERADALAYPIELLIRCLDSNGAANGSEYPERQRLYARLCRLDPVRALNWTA
ncbi:MAG TPA: type VI secretion system protein TssA [Bryobacteraceae bacterium]|nr:type VI secretion system protein TssA [Bryobacteraceae bacterium]